MSNFYVIGEDVDAIKQFFSVLPEEERPKIVSDKEYPKAWDHVSDDPTVIVTSEPRLDTDAKQIVVDGQQADEVLAQMKPNEEVASEDPTIDVPHKEEEEEPVKGPMTYSDRGFKVGRIV